MTRIIVDDNEDVVMIEKERKRLSEDLKKFNWKKPDRSKEEVEEVEAFLGQTGCPAANPRS